jgi:tetratricopeptide (TPR) repeat protein
MFPLHNPWFYMIGRIILLISLVALVGTGVSFGVRFLYFVVVPGWAIKKLDKTNPERLRRYLEVVVATPSFNFPKLVARTALVGIYLTRGRHAEAAAHCRANLAELTAVRCAGNFSALEADVRRKLADCLEALGQTDEAEDERRLAETCVDQAPDDPLRHLTQGTLLQRQNRHAEACAAFEQALSLTPASNRDARIECMIHLVLACYNAGRPAESLHWAEEAIALGAQGRLLRAAHKMAGITNGNLGRLEESEDHFRRAYDVAGTEGNTGEMGQILGSLADIQRKRGKLVEANDAAFKAAAVHPEAVRMATAVQSQILRVWGRYDEALEMLRRHNQATKLVIPALERRVRAAVALDMSRIEAECGRADDAWVHIREALAELGTDAKLGLKCDAAASWVFAARGLADESLRVAGQVEARLPAFEADPSTCRGVLFDLGMAACTRGDHEAGEDCWTRYLELSPEPVYHPTALYFRGECRRHLGDTSNAATDFRAAVALDIDTHHARLARRQLQAMWL